MARIETDPNYTAPTFSRATAGTDLFKKEDVQALAAAVSTHDHSTGKGAILAAGSIPAGSITSGMIADGTIVAGDIADGAVTSAKILDGTIATVDIADKAVTNAKLASDTARANLLANGGFEIWQRGSGPFTASGGYTADRWVMNITAGTMSVTRDTANADVGSTYCALVTTTGAGPFILTQASSDLVASVRGRTMSLSVRVKCNVASCIRVGLNDGINPSSYSGYHSGSGTYETLSVTHTFATNATTAVTNLQTLLPVTNAAFDNAMLVVGSVAADYAPLHPADDLARCLRYYEVIGSGNAAGLSMGGHHTAGGLIYMPLVYKVVKAVTPTVTKNGTWNATNCSQPTVGGPDTTVVQLATVVTALGTYNFFNTGAGSNVSVEANP